MQRNLTMPAALRGSVFAAAHNDDPQELFRQINATLDQLKARNGARLDGVEETVTNLSNSLTAMQRQYDGGFAPVGNSILPVDSQYSNTFASYFRRGDSEDALRQANATGERATVQAALSVGTNSDGGFLAPVEWDRRVQQAQRATSPMRRLASVQQTGVGAYTTLWNNEAWGSGWVGETAARPQTTNASLSQITFPTGEIYAMPATTSRLLDDSLISIEDWLVNSIREEFNRQEGIAFLSGDGVNKLMGLLQYVVGGAGAGAHPGGNLTVTVAAIGVDTLIDFTYGLAAPYRQNASWLMSSLTAASIAKMKDLDGNLIWRESLISGQPSTLLGRPVEIDESMPGPTSNNLAIAFGDFRAVYLINDRIGTRILRDPFTNKPFVMFYTTKRVGGGLLDNSAIRLLRIPV